MNFLLVLYRSFIENMSVPLIKNEPNKEPNNQLSLIENKPNNELSLIENEQQNNQISDSKIDFEIKNFELEQAQKNKFFTPINYIKIDDKILSNEDPIIKVLESNKNNLYFVTFDVRDEKNVLGSLVDTKKKYNPVYYFCIGNRENGYKSFKYNNDDNELINKLMTELNITITDTNIKEHLQKLLNLIKQKTSPNSQTQGQKQGYFSNLFRGKKGGKTSKSTFKKYSQQNKKQKLRSKWNSRKKYL